MSRLQAKTARGRTGKRARTSQLALLLALVAGGPLATAKEAPLSPDDCVELRRYLHQQLQLRPPKQAEYDEWQNTFNSFYKDSQVAMEVVYEPTAWTLDVPVPFTGLSFAAEVPKPVSVTGGMEYVPKIRLTGAVSRRATVLAWVKSLEKLSALVSATPLVTKALSAFKAGFSHLTDVLLPYEEGVEIHGKYVESRKVMLANYSKILTVYYCDNILPLETEILKIRDEAIPASDCSALEAQVLITDVTRGSRIRNAEHLRIATDWCAAHAPQGLSPEAERAAAMYAHLFCVVSNPQFWDDFMEEMFEGEDAAAKEADAEAMRRLYRKYGFENDQDSTASVKKYAGDSAFQDLVVKKVQSRCNTSSAEVDLVRQSLRKILLQ